MREKIIMAFCVKCGQKLNESDSFCPNCGNKVVKKVVITNEKRENQPINHQQVIDQAKESSHLALLNCKPQPIIYNDNRQFYQGIHNLLLCI